MTSGDTKGDCGGVCARIFSLISREADGEDDGASMSCTYPIDLKPRTLRRSAKPYRVEERPQHLLIPF